MTHAENSRLAVALAHKENKVPGKQFLIKIINRDGDHIGHLACIDRNLSVQPEILINLTTWRQRYMRFFLTQFEPTVSRTKLWLENVVIPSQERMFFVIFLPTGKAIGNFGVCNMSAASGELDNLIRGEKGGAPRLIYFSELALLSWMFGHLGYGAANLHVFSDNHPTINLHSSVGFSVVDSAQLTRKHLPDGVSYLINSGEAGPVDFSYLEMRISRKEFLSMHPWICDVYAHDWQ